MIDSGECAGQMFQKPPRPQTLQEFIKSLRIEYTKPERGQGGNQLGVRRSAGSW